jgi:sigma-B regulation protein RsbU (phosphoserine phosphatase)
MTFSFASAGHPPALLVRPSGSGEIRELKGKGMLMCVVPDLVVQEESVAVLPGDKIFLCTDGIFDLFVRLNIRAGLEKMGRFLLEMRDKSIDRDVQKLLARHNDLAKTGEVTDDATVVAIQFNQPHRGAQTR